LNWTPVFSLIKGVVVDRGGAISHGAIVAREYGIPAVVNTFQGSAKIKTGNKRVVYILE
jgi:phosphoenolpyruvate synthase/pyruvate phosphate dikinase